MAIFFNRKDFGLRIASFLLSYFLVFVNEEGVGGYRHWAVTKRRRKCHGYNRDEIEVKRASVTTFTSIQDTLRLTPNGNCAQILVHPASFSHRRLTRTLLVTYVHAILWTSSETN